MDPYSQTVPHQRDPNHYPYQYYPIRAESIPSEMRADSFKHPSPCPPHHINHINACHHSCSPCYYSYQPPFPSPPQPPYCYGHCPPPYAYSASYLVPPHYSINQAGYDYDKPRYSCCGCLNHTCHPRDNSFPHIQEEQHLTEKVSDRDSSRLITQQESPPNPVIWAPHLSIKSTSDHGASSMSQQPGQSHSSWFPVDMNNLGRFKQDSDSDSEGRKEEQVEDIKTRWRQYTPFPVFWMPGGGGGYNEAAAEEVKKGAKEMPTKAVENWPWPSNVKIVPLNLIENENQEKQKDDAALVDEEPTDSVQSEAPREKERSKIKIVPVKQLAEEINPKQIQIVNPQIPQGKEADDQTESLTPPVKHKENSDQVKKASEKKQSSPKPSKLPPVCLRVDPFPKRKTANATTSRRSPPSLPGLKKTKMNNCEQDEEQGPKKDEESSKEEILHVVNERENLSSQAEDKEEDSGGRKENKLVISGSETEEEEKRMDSKEMKSVVDGEMEMELVVNKGHAETHHESSQCVDKNKGGAGRKDLSETDAATVIQSAYRGFEVRKCQPLKKLQEIVHIREQVDTIRRKIQEMEASSEKLDSKQRVVISETIMNLLLQLDTIQGLDPSVREVRKSVARDLVCLQEKVDMLSSQSTEEHVLVKHEAERVKAIDGEGDSVSSAVSMSSQKQESMEQIHAIDKRTTEKTKQIEETFSGSAEYAEASHIASPSSIQESASEIEPVNPVDKFGMEDRLFFKKEESNQPPDNELAVDLNLPVGSEAALEQDTDVIPMTEPVSEQIFAQPREKRIDLDDQLLESIEATDSVQGRLEDRIERAKLSSDIEVSETSELATNDESCNQEQSTDALVSTDEGCIKSFGDAVHGGGVNELSEPEPEPEPAQEVNNQQLAEIEEVNGSDATVDQDMRKPLTKLYEAQSNHKEDDLVISEMVQPILDAEESLINITQEDELRPEMVALMERKEDDPQVAWMGQTEADPQEAKLEKKEEDQHNEQDMLQTSLCAKASDSIKISEGGDDDNVDVPNYEFINETVDPSIVEKNVVISGDDSKMAKTEAVNFANSKSYLKDEEKRLVEENEKLRVMLERLLDSGREQLGAISNLSNRVKELERKLAHKKRMKIRRNKPVSKLM